MRYCDACAENHNLPKTCAKSMDTCDICRMTRCFCNNSLYLGKEKGKSGLKLEGEYFELYQGDDSDPSECYTIFAGTTRIFLRCKYHEAVKIFVELDHYCYGISY